MTGGMRHAPFAERLSLILLAAASLALAWHPVEWLVATWTEPSHASVGYLYFGAVLAIAVVSLRSGPVRGGARGLPFGLFALAAGVRLLSQVLAINLLGGLALAVDVFALARAAGLERRPRPVSPFWFAALFLFALPLGKVIERLLGFPLQMVSARLSCGALSLVYPGTECAGVRIGIGGQDVLVDLPCAGASGLMLMMALYAGLSAWQAPRFRVAVLWGVVTLALAVAGNALRIALIAAALADGVDAMAEPLHSTIGLFTLGLSALPLLVFYRAPVRRPVPTPVRAGRLPSVLRLPASVMFVALAGWIVTRPAAPVDVSAGVTPQPFPAALAGAVGRKVPLSPVEALYFTAYGGTAEKVQYGLLGLNRVSTTSPLRHLHSPETCLNGLGYGTRFLGTRHEGAPSSVYEATGPDGTVWLVAVTYVSDDGRAVTSVGEAVWHWLNGRGRTWSAVQRITPLALDPDTRRRLEDAALAALDIPISKKEPLS